MERPINHRNDLMERKENDMTRCPKSILVVLLLTGGTLLPQALHARARPVKPRLLFTVEKVSTKQGTKRWVKRLQVVFCCQGIAG